MIPLALSGWILYERIGKAAEPAFTTAIRAEFKELKEDVGSLATDSRITEFEGKLSMIARTQDTKAGKEAMHAMELRILNKIDESRRETVRLLVAALKKQGGTP